MKKNYAKISFIIQLVISFLCCGTVILGTGFMVKYFQDNCGRYTEHLLEYGNYSLYEMMANEINAVFRGFQIGFLIAFVLTAAAGIVAYHFNKSSSKAIKIAVIAASVLPVAVTLIYPVILSVTMQR